MHDGAKFHNHFHTLKFFLGRDKSGRNSTLRRFVSDLSYKSNGAKMHNPLGPLGESLKPESKISAICSTRLFGSSILQIKSLCDI